MTSTKVLWAWHNKIVSQNRLKKRHNIYYSDTRDTHEIILCLFQLRWNGYGSKQCQRLHELLPEVGLHSRYGSTGSTATWYVLSWLIIGWMSMRPMMLIAYSKLSQHCLLAFSINGHNLRSLRWRSKKYTARLILEYDAFPQDRHRSKIKF